MFPPFGRSCFFICSLKLNIPYMFYKLKIMSTAKQQSPDRFNDRLLSPSRVLGGFLCKEGQNNQICEEWICVCFYYNNKSIWTISQKSRKNKKIEDWILLPESVQNLAWKWNSRLFKLARIWKKNPKIFHVVLVSLLSAGFYIPGCGITLLNHRAYILS